jgi:hypothetical protein
MNKPQPLINPHRFARLVAWLQALLAWAAQILFATTARPNRRHIRQRYGFISLDRIERCVRALVITHAVQLAQLRRRQRPLRNAAAFGFRRRIARGGLLRAAVGARVRKALKHRDPAQRIQRLVGALANIDAFARRYLLARAKRRLTRLHAVLIAAPMAEPVFGGPPRAPCAADTS